MAKIINAKRNSLALMASEVQFLRRPVRFHPKLGWAAGEVFKDQGISSFIIGKDTRISGYMLEAALQAE